MRKYQDGVWECKIMADGQLGKQVEPEGEKAFFEGDRRLGDDVWRERREFA